MNEPTTSDQAISLAEAALVDVRRFHPCSPQYAKARGALLGMTGRVLTGLLPPSSWAQYDLAAELYRAALEVKEQQSVYMPADR